MCISVQENLRRTRLLQIQKSPHEGGYEDATKFFTVSLSSDG